MVISTHAFEWCREPGRVSFDHDRERSVNCEAGPASGTHTFASGPFFFQCRKITGPHRPKENGSGRPQETGLRLSASCGVRGAQLPGWTSPEARAMGRQDRLRDGRGYRSQSAHHHRDLRRTYEGRRKTLAAAQGAGHGGQHGSTGDKLDPIAEEKRWLKLWAFATSPYGLALSSDAFWDLTSIELDALKYEWAQSRALTLNMQAQTDGVAFTPEDVLNPGSRAHRVAQITAKKNVEQMEAQAMNFKVQQLRRNKSAFPDSLVPEWAKGKRR